MVEDILAGRGKDTQLREEIKCLKYLLLDNKPES